MEPFEAPQLPQKWKFPAPCLHPLSSLWRATVQNESLREAPGSPGLPDVEPLSTAQCTKPVLLHGRCSENLNLLQCPNVLGQDKGCQRRESGLSEVSQLLEDVGSESSKLVIPQHSGGTGPRSGFRTQGCSSPSCELAAYLHILCTCYHHVLTTSQEDFHAWCNGDALEVTVTLYWLYPQIFGWIHKCGAHRYLRLTVYC